jgi:hypothetical protein
MMQLVVITVVLVGLVMMGLSFNLIFRRRDFPETHVGHNKEMKKKGITCVKTFDKMEQNKAWQKDRFSNLLLDRRE